jgi:hypothetical protein
LRCSFVREKDVDVPRGVMIVADSAEEAKNQVLMEAPHVRVLRCREIDLTGLPSLAGRSLQRHWAVVVEHQDPAEEAKLPQHADPEDRCERETRLLYLKLGVDPNLLVTGVVEQFACPACDNHVRLELPPPGAGPPRLRAQCPRCRSVLQRPRERAPWQVAPPAPKGASPCVFCPAAANSKEHAIPGWISKRLGVRDFLPADSAFVLGSMAPRTQPISFASYRARVLCTDCNTHFKHLEDAVIPLLVPMARDISLSLDAASRSRLARWAHKTAIALLAATPELREAVPAEHRRAVRDTDQAHRDVWVGFFSWRGGPVLGTAQGGITSPETRHRACR